MHGKCGDLLVGFPTMIAVVWFTGRMNNMVFVKAGVFCEALFTPRHCAHIWFLTCSGKAVKKKKKKVLLICERSEEPHRCLYSLAHYVFYIQDHNEEQSKDGLLQI